MQDTPKRFSAGSRIIHWLTALIVFGLLILGFYMTELDASPFTISLYGWHKSFGVLVLLLLGLRMVLFAFKRPPGPLPTWSAFEAMLSKAVKLVLYLALLALPLSGWVMSSAGDFPVSFFGFFELPALTNKDEDLFELMEEVHEITAFVIVGALAFHLAGAFKHHFLDRDDTLRRISSARLGLIGGALVFLVYGALWAVPAFMIVEEFTEAEAPHDHGAHAPSEEVHSEDILRPDTPELPPEMLENRWTILPDQSRIGFTVTQSGDNFQGVFKNFKGLIVFDPDALEDSTAQIEIDITSLDTGAETRDETAMGPDWFDTANFPKAFFISERFEILEDEPYRASGKDARYRVHGTLTLRGVSLPLSFPFTLHIEDTANGQRAVMSASFILNRLDFGIGRGEWKSTETIGNTVGMNILIEAEKP